MSKPWAIHCDWWITRRKRYHVVVNPDGIIEWKARLLGECIEYLAAQDVFVYQLHVEPVGTPVLLTLDVELKEPPKWQN